MCYRGRLDRLVGNSTHFASSEFEKSGDDLPTVKSRSASSSTHRRHLETWPTEKHWVIFRGLNGWYCWCNREEVASSSRLVSGGGIALVVQPWKQNVGDR